MRRFAKALIGTFLILCVCTILCGQSEFLVDSSKIFSVLSSETPSVCFGDGIYLVAWAGTGTFYPGIYGARVNSLGELIDTIAIWIGTRGSDPPKVAYNGTNFLVVWATTSAMTGDIYGARVTGDGTVLDFPAPLPICIDSSQWGCQRDPDVATDGQDWLIAWEDMRSGGFDLYGRIVHGNGIMEQEFIINNALFTQGNPSIAFDGTNYFVVWHDGRSSMDYPSIYGGRVRSSGVVIDSAGIPLSGAQSPVTADLVPRVAFDSTNYLVVWNRALDLGNADFVDIYARFVDTSSCPLNEPFSIWGDSIFGSWDSQVEIAFNGSNHMAAWSRDYSLNDIYATRITPSGQVIDSTRILICDGPGSQGLPRISSNGSDFLVVWEDWRGAPAQISTYASRIDSSGTVLDPNGFSIPFMKCAESYASSVEGNGTEYLTAWTCDRYTGYPRHIYGSRMALDGSVLDPDGIAICTYDSNKDYPSVASDGKDFLVVWEDWRIPGRAIFGTLVDSAGVVSDTNGSPLYSDQSAQPDVSFGGKNYLVIYGRGYNGIGATRVSSMGVIIDSFTVSNYGSIYSYPSIQFGNSHYLAVWGYFLGSGQCDIYGMRIDTLGNVMDSAEIFISTAPNVQSAPDVAYDGVNFLVVWGDNRNGQDFDIYGARIDEAGNVLDPSGFVIQSAAGQQITPTITFDGSNYTVGWEDYAGYMDFHRVYEAKVSPSGSVLDTFLISINQGGETMRPSLAYCSGDSIIVTYTKSAGYPFNGRRIWASHSNPVAVSEMEGADFQKPSVTVFPNPCAQSPILRILNPSKQHVEIHIFDISGRKIRTLHQGFLTNGMHTFIWDNKNNLGNRVAQGLYFLQCKAPGFNVNEKIVLLKKGGH